MKDPAMPDATSSTIKTEEKIIIPVHEEEISIDKVKVEIGQVRIEKDVVDEQVAKEVTLKKKQVNITRIPKNEVVDTPPAVRREGNITIIPVVKEVVIVRKELVLTEEIHIEQKVETEVEEIHATVRKEEVNIKRD